MIKVTDFDLKTLALANRNSGTALLNLKRAQARNAVRGKASLYGGLGGALGICLAYGLKLWLQWALLTSAIGCCLAGIVLGLALYHLARRNNFEAKMEENKVAMQEVLARIRGLPKNAPAEVREELWQIYRSLNVELPGNSERAMQLSAANNAAAMMTVEASHAPTAATNVNPLPSMPPPANQSIAPATHPNAKPPLTPAQKQAATAALKRALEEVENHALNMAFNDAEQQNSLAARLQTRQPMEWKQERREVRPQERASIWPEEAPQDAGETVFANTGEVFHAGQKVVRPAVFPRMKAAG